jgi:exoribonuclease-2
MYQGKIVEYIDQGSFICTLCLQDKGNRLHLLTPLNREVNLSPKRAFLISDRGVNVLGPREELLISLKRIEDRRHHLQKKVKTKELWELVRDEKESFDCKYLAQLCFGEDITDDHVSAIVRALFEDKLYFKMKDGLFYPNSESRVDQLIKQIEEEAKREAILKEGSAWLRAVGENKQVQEPTRKEDILALLIELVLYEKDAPNFKQGKDLLSRSGISHIEAARDLLVRLGIWEEDENLDLLKMEIPTFFNEAQLEESGILARMPLVATGREDLRHLPTMTIDGPMTLDFDDAVSMEIAGETIRLGVHIADVAGTLPVDCLIYNEAYRRGSSLYLPRRQISMIPPNLSHDALSLTAGCDRPAISLLCRFDNEGNLLEHRFVPSLVRVGRRLTYDQVNVLYKEEELLEKMVRLSQSLRQKRIDQGALILSLPEVVVNLGKDASINFEMISQETPSRMLISEFMILFNWLTARFCRDNNIPILYRSQEKPSEIISTDDLDHVFYVFRQRRKLTPLLISTEPKPHSGLGLDVYTNASSPLRRFLDLVIQVQLRNFLLKGSTIYKEEALEKMRISVEPVLRDLEKLKRNRIRYWIHKYLQQHIGETFVALILYEMKKKYRILLKDFLLMAELKRENGQNFSEGEHIRVKIIKSEPKTNLLKLEYVGAG